MAFYRTVPPALIKEQGILPYVLSVLSHPYDGARYSVVAITNTVLQSNTVLRSIGRQRLHWLHGVMLINYFVSDSTA